MLDQFVAFAPFNVKISRKQRNFSNLKMIIPANLVDPKKHHRHYNPANSILPSSLEIARPRNLDFDIANDVRSRDKVVSDL